MYTHTQFWNLDTQFYEADSNHNSKFFLHSHTQNNFKYKMHHHSVDIFHLFGLETKFQILLFSPVLHLEIMNGTHFNFGTLNCGCITFCLQMIWFSFLIFFVLFWCNLKRFVSIFMIIHFVVFKFCFLFHFHLKYWF